MINKNCPLCGNNNLKESEIYGLECPECGECFEENDNGDLQIVSFEKWREMLGRRENDHDSRLF